MKKTPDTPAAIAIEQAKRIAWISSLPVPRRPFYDDISSGWAYAWPDDEEDEEEEFPEIETGWAYNFDDEDDEDDEEGED